MTDEYEFDGCRRTCRITGSHTLIWGECEFAEVPEPTLTIGTMILATDGHPSLVIKSLSKLEVSDIIRSFIEPLSLDTEDDIVSVVVDGLIDTFPDRL